MSATTTLKITSQNVVHCNRNSLKTSFLQLFTSLSINKFIFHLTRSMISLFISTTYFVRSLFANKKQRRRYTSFSSIIKTPCNTICKCYYPTDSISYLRYLLFELFQPRSVKKIVKIIVLHTTNEDYNHRKKPTDTRIRISNKISNIEKLKLNLLWISFVVKLRFIRNIVRKNISLEVFSSFFFEKSMKSFHRLGSSPRTVCYPYTLFDFKAYSLEWNIELSFVYFISKRSFASHRWNDIDSD